MDLSARIGTVTTAEPFVIARGTEEVNEVLWVELWQDGVVGRGEVLREGRDLLFQVLTSSTGRKAVPMQFELEVDCINLGGLVDLQTEADLNHAAVVAQIERHVLPVQILTG